MMVEIGGTVGDIENSWFIEAVRELKKEVGAKNTLYIHLTYVPFLSAVGEAKTKPAQRDLALLREKGIYPNIIITRSKDILPEKVKKKLSLFCDIDQRCIISSKDVSTIYDIPIIFEKQGLFDIISRKFGLDETADLDKWKQLVEKIKNPGNQVNIAICGKYTALKDSYASIIEALIHAGAHLDTKVNLRWLETTDIEQGRLSVNQALEGVKGVIVPGGFGKRGAEGKMAVIKHARENNIPYLGLCFGLQLAVVEFARNVCGLDDANSTEVNIDTENPIIDIMPEQKEVMDKGGTMRLGKYEAELMPGTKTYQMYGSAKVNERHRHRYEVNPDYHNILKEKGLVLSGMHGELVEFIELPEHKFFIATQSHPEFKSRLEKPAPLFYEFVKTTLN